MYRRFVNHDWFYSGCILLLMFATCVAVAQENPKAEEGEGEFKEKSPYEKIYQRFSERDTHDDILNNKKTLSSARSAHKSQLAVYKITARLIEPMIEDGVDSADNLSLGFGEGMRDERAAYRLKMAERGDPRLVKKFDECVAQYTEELGAYAAIEKCSGTSEMGPDADQPAGTTGTGQQAENASPVVYKASVAKLLSKGFEQKQDQEKYEREFKRWWGDLQFKREVTTNAVVKGEETVEPVCKSAGAAVCKLKDNEQYAEYYKMLVRREVGLVGHAIGIHQDAYFRNLRDFMYDYCQDEVKRSQASGNTGALEGYENGDFDFWSTLSTTKGEGDISYTYDHKSSIGKLSFGTVFEFDKNIGKELLELFRVDSTGKIANDQPLNCSIIKSSFNYNSYYDLFVSISRDDKITDLQRFYFTLARIVGTMQTLGEVKTQINLVRMLTNIDDDVELEELGLRLIGEELKELAILKLPVGVDIKKPEAAIGVAIDMLKNELEDFIIELHKHNAQSRGQKMPAMVQNQTRVGAAAVPK